MARYRQLYHAHRRSPRAWPIRHPLAADLDAYGTPVRKRERRAGRPRASRVQRVQAARQRRNRHAVAAR